MSPRLLLSIPVIPLYAYGHSPVVLGIGAVLMQFMVQGAWGVVPAYLTELSPGPVRATAPGFAYHWEASLHRGTEKARPLRPNAGTIIRPFSQLPFLW